MKEVSPEVAVITKQCKCQFLITLKDMNQFWPFLGVGAIYSPYTVTFSLFPREAILSPTDIYDVVVAGWDIKGDLFRLEVI